MADTLARLAQWLEPFTVTMSAEVLAARRRLVEGLAEDATLDAHTVVAAAYGQFPGDAEQRIETAVLNVDPSVVVADRRQLASALVGAALLVRLAGGPSEAHPLLALLVQSAEFIGLEPAIPELPSAAASSLAAAARRSRQRMEPEETVREVRLLLTKSPAQTDSDLPAAVKARDAALRAIARRVETLVDSMETRFALLDEELDLLWWARRGRSSATDEPWQQMVPPARAAQAATDIGLLLAHVPAPTSVRSLLREALGAEAETDFPIIDVAIAMSPAKPSYRLLLLPLSTYRSIAAELGEDDREAVARLYSRTVSCLSSQTERPLIDCAEQVLREFQIARCL